MQASLKSKPVLRVKDHSVSKQWFELHHDGVLDMYQTFPKPKLEELDNYYESESYISHTDSSTGILDKAYQVVKRYMLRKKVDLVTQQKAEGSLLDIGAGTGDFLNAANKSGYQVLGVEPNSFAREKASQKNIRLKKSITEINGHFDVITMWHVLEHVYDLDDQLNWLKDHLALDGVLIVAVPNFKSWDAKHYKDFWAAWDVPRHLHHFSQNGIKTILEKKGFVLKKTMPLIFDAFYVSLLSEKYKKNPFAFFKGLWFGLRSNLNARQTGEYSSLIYVFEASKID